MCGSGSCSTGGFCDCQPGEGCDAQGHCVIITSDNACAPTRTDGLCADLVTPGDVAELTGALGALLADPERRAEMGRAGRRRVDETFSWRAVAVAVTAAYEQAMADHRRERASVTTEMRHSADR